MPNWALKGCCDKDQKIFLITIAIFTVVIFATSSPTEGCKQSDYKGKNNLIDDSKATQGDLIITREEDEVQIEDLDVTQAVRSEELMHPAAAVPELIMPLKVMILQPEVFDAVPTKSPSESAPIIINEVVNGESKDDIVLGKEAKTKRIEIGNIEESLMKIDFDEFKDLISMPIDFLWRTFVLTPFKLITVFLHEASHAIACKLTCGQVEGIKVHANEGGVTQTRGGIYWLILPAGLASEFYNCFLHSDLGSSFWGMALILASTTLLTTRIAAGCFIVALIVVLFVAKNWTLRGLCIGFIIFIAVIWLLQEYTKLRILRYAILFIDIYDDLISRRVNSSDAEKFAELCPCPCNGAAWGVIWGMISFAFLGGAIYLGLVILS
ncbi:hypothetical protein TEA_011664 [Camellia sinensis var. sinensis]|uniref:Uncharacterized protein n=1 Tax=Camellia sinensis var. sinensis TaxID=542762 RepID=A0A4S4F3Z8_CAMSN|nr:hypothetical protein TEA_011664 [Camellia sinensis var. sinensis]